MILPGEIHKRAGENGVRPQQIEKDYILSWILYGIATHERLSKILVFKGGTVLKKVYFEDYRFSEDLDFTLIDDTIARANIFPLFNEVFDWVRSEANISLQIRDGINHEDGGFNFYIQYQGPLGGNIEDREVKVDISRAEKMAFEPVVQPAILPYSDLQPYLLLCYPLEEVYVEKMRSILQRTQARDLYDIWYLMENEGMDLTDYLQEYFVKCAQKEVDGKRLLEVLKEKMSTYRAQWNEVLVDQIRDLPDFDQVEREILRGLRNINF